LNLDSAEAISSDGRFIVGRGRNQANQTEAFLVDLLAAPVPEPSTWALSASGLAIFFLIRSKRFIK
jgi:hypothetical protein